MSKFEMPFKTHAQRERWFLKIFIDIMKHPVLFSKPDFCKLSVYIQLDESEAKMYDTVYH